jgi:methylase of polypeptide subunit release factors
MPLGASQKHGMSSVRSAQEIASVLQALRTRLSVAGYTPDALKRSLGITYPDDVGLLNRAPALERLRDDRSPAGTLMRLLFLEGAEPERRVAGVLSRRLYEQLLRCGLLQRSSRGVRAQLRIDAVADQYLLADRRFRPGRTRAFGLPGRDPVYPPGSDSLILRGAIFAPDARRVLDLCTGSGVQALRLAHNAETYSAKTHSTEQIVAVDLNPRAVAVARLNAQLNGAPHVDVRVGDLYAPVGGAQFDLIIANPPFVASPYAGGPAYHSGGAVGDAVLRRVIAGWHARLTPGGRAFAITHRALRAGEKIEAVAQSWLRNFPGRSLVLILECGTAVDLAAAQAQFALRRGLEAYGREVARWTDYLRRLRVSTVAVLLIVAERTDEQRIEVIEAQPRVLPIPLTPPVADRVAAWFR